MVRFILQTVSTPMKCYNSLFQYHLAAPQKVQLCGFTGCFQNFVA